MPLKQKVKELIIKVRKLPLWIQVSASVVLVVFIACTVAFFLERNVQFSYNNNTCVQHLTILPSISKLSDKSPVFNVENKDIIRIGNFQLLSFKTCFTAMKVPKVGNTKLSMAPFGGWFARKTFNVIVPQPPIASVDVLSKPIPTIRPLKISLSSADSIFKYQLAIDNKSIAPCPVKGSVLTCDIASLNLIQDKNYRVELIRMFDGQKVASIVTKSIKTLKATSVISASLRQDQIVYDKPKSFTFGFDKEITKANFVLEKIVGEKRTTILTTSAISSKQVIITVSSDLDRDANYEFTIDHLEASDGSTLPATYKLGFKVSDGPGVVSVNVGSYGLPQTKTIVLNLDQGILAGQDITKYVSVRGVASAVSITGSQVFISYSNAPICADLNIVVKPGLQSSYGIVQNNSWSFTTRTICHTVSAIGYSKGGRPILAYTFGSGVRAELFTGAIHGNELSAKYLMEAWINELEANARNIPADKTVVIIPTLNPDGIALNTRNNLGNIDLNRNFPTADWQTDIVSPTNQPEPGGGGSIPLSEPESLAIATFTAQLCPRLTMSFHSSAGYTIGNQAGDSGTLATAYANLTGYRNMTGNGGAFSYPITGSYDDWIREQLGLPSVLVELSSNGNSEFTRNKAALWTMLRS